MASDGRFAIGLAAWLFALLATSFVFAWAVMTPDLAMVRLLAGLAVLGAGIGLWRHVTRTNRMLARFLEALGQTDWAARFDARGGSGFDMLGAAMNEAMRALKDERGTIERELRFLEALIDDVPVALLIADDRGIRPANKAARRVFDRHAGADAEAYSCYGASFANLLAEPQSGRRELLILTLHGGLQRALIHVATLTRLGARTHLIAVEPLQGTLDTIEVAAQTDLVRVLTHEILNSLTPILSLAGTADAKLRQTPPDPEGAQIAVTTLDHRTQGLLSFINAYRSVAQPLKPRPTRFEALPFAEELGRLFRADWPSCQFSLTVEPRLTLLADPDLLAQAAINLLRNAGQATAELGAEAEVALTLRSTAQRVLIEIEDNGPGIAEAIVPDIFLPFFTTKSGGSGVGLNLVRQIVVASGGAVDYSARQPRGARFTMRLPR